MREQTRTLLEGGEQALRDMIGHPEAYNLEFKSKENPEEHVLSKDDRRNLGKTLSGFSNAAGGLVIFGIRTVTKDHQDVADKLDPIARIERFKSEVDGRLGELLLPANPSITTNVIRCDDDADKGYLLVDIEESDLRPHMSMAPGHQKYFLRSVLGTISMEHNMVRDAMLAPRAARLEPRFYVESGSVSGGEWRHLKGFLGLNLKNVGRAMAMMPYARVWTVPRLSPGAGQRAVHLEGRPDGSVAFYGTRDSVVHPDDEIRIGVFAIEIAVAQSVLEAALDRGRIWPDEIDRGCRFGSGFSQRENSFAQEFQTVRVDLQFGAENALPERQRIEISRRWALERALRCNAFHFDRDRSIKVADTIAALRSG